MDTAVKKLVQLSFEFDGEILVDDLHRIIYATDASAYREKPVGVAYPRNIKDIKSLIKFAGENQIPLIPRAAGTSLAGQVVGNGLVVDCSKYMNRIIEVNPNEKWVKVEPGVILDELNLYLKKYKLFFAPETSTSSRCTIGGMFGNNSCGSHSIIYGSTRDHIIEADVILSDGSEAKFSPLEKKEFSDKCSDKNLEGKIYSDLFNILDDKNNQQEIINEFPRKEIHRRNNGYAIDQLLDSETFGVGENKFNMCKLLAGSEGTLAFTTEMKLNLLPLPPENLGALIVHLNSVEEAFEANLIGLKYNPGAIEIIDHNILECTKANREQAKNRSFIKGSPSAILVIEFARDTKEEITKITENLKKELQQLGYGYHFPVLMNSELNKVWALRKAGLGLLSNIKGDKKAEPFIEDVAVRPEDLPDYMEELYEILKKNNLECVHYAHIGSGEMHIRPKINLKDSSDVELFHSITKEVAHLAKKYKGSLSGEHGDGRLRGEFIPIIIGEKNYQLCKQVKKIWDPKNILNPGKIVDTPKMNENLRYIADSQKKDIETVYDFSSVDGILNASEKCNGSGDCRNSEKIDGTMCPSFKATRDEKHTTRARANTLREFLTRSNEKNPFNHKELYEVMDLCLSCKACKAECPSSVDVAKLKAEFLQHYYDSNGIPLRTRLVAYISLLNSFNSFVPSIANFFMSLDMTKKILKISQKRELPFLSKVTFSKWYKKNKAKYEQKNFPNGKVYLFNDEFTNYNDAEIGIKGFKLLTELGYQVVIPKHIESGRSFISKGLLRKAKQIAKKNIDLLKNEISPETPLVGIEPSAILTFRDEYLDLIDKEEKETAERISDSAYTFDEFLLREIEKGKIKKESFTTQNMKVKLHCHCQQEAIASSKATLELLSFPENYSVEEIPSGCCGMAGSFGYEEEHYEVSMKIGELVLFPEIRKTETDTLISASGTSCRHQIKDGTGRSAKHSIEILYEALKN